MNDLRPRVASVARRGRVAVGLGAVVVAAACAPGTTPNADPTTTTTPVTTTTDDPKITTTTEDPKVTTTTEDPKLTTTTSGPTTTVPVDGTLVDVDDLAPGMCASPPDGKDSVAEVVSKACDEPHDVEVFGVLEWSPESGTADGFPGGAALRERAYSLCQEPFADYVGVAQDSSGLLIVPYAPDALAWEVGERGVTCAVSLADGPLEGSVRGSEAPTG